MEHTYLLIYNMIAVLLSAVDFWFARKAFRKAERLGRAMGFAAVFAGVITLAYVISVNTRDPLWVSVSSGVCFSGIDWMLVSLVIFAFMVTGEQGGRTSRVARGAVMALALADTAMMGLNAFTGVVVGFEPLDPVGISYQMKTPYVIHLVFTYALIAVTLGVLIFKCAHTPRQYRNQYLYLAASIGVVVLINAVFLFTDSQSFFMRVDCSVLGYSVGLYLMYWTAFDYRINDMLESLSMTIFENISQGIVLFDYADALIMRNRRADELLKGVAFPPQMRKGDFLKTCGVAIGPGDACSVQCDREEGAPLRCDYRRLRDARGGAVGSLFVFTDISRDTDLTTGFEYARDFDAFAAGGGPAAVAVFDLLGLKEVNRVLGRDAGDRRIRVLAKLMRQHMPQNTRFLRGFEANLIAVCPGASEADIAARAEEVAAQSDSAVLYGLSDAAGDDGADGRALAQALETAGRSLMVKKLLTAGSARSQTLASLTRALEEADTDTEAHVRRTRKMGATLGRRIGLRDAQLADLELLCLLHDIGKIGIPLEILNKPGRLTEQEWVMLRTHPEKGYQIAMSSDELKSIAEMILYHHERWDGEGYPAKLAGKQIPVLSRIIAIVDAYDAMVNDRAYRKAMSPEEAQREIRDNAGTQFDPELAAEFLKMLAEQPDIAVGERVGREVRVFAPASLQQAGTGDTRPILYSRYLLDMDERIVEVDDRFETVTGYSPAEAVGMLQSELVPAADRAYYLVQVNNQFTHGDIAYLRHALQRRDGAVIEVACCGKRFYDSAARVFRSEIIIFELDGK